MSVVPAFIPSSRSHLDEMMERSAFAPSIQIDIVDGHFAPASSSWPYGEGGDLATALRNVDLTGRDAELDLMIDAPEDTLDAWAATGATRIAVHVEGVHDMDAVYAHRARSSYMLGLALSLDTDLGMLARYDAGAFDYVLLMSIAEIGAQGHAFDERVLARIETVRRSYPGLPIAIDGGVTRETLPRAKAAGADRFVVGSAIWNAPDPVLMYTELSALAA